MKTIEVSAAKLGLRANAHYQRYVVANGHVAGFLSGAELEGKARLWSGKYEASRRSIEQRVHQHYGVRSDLLLSKDTHRLQRVWMKGKRPVRLVITSAPEDV